MRVDAKKANQTNRWKRIISNAMGYDCRYYMEITWIYVKYLDVLEWFYKVMNKELYTDDEGCEKGNE